MWGKGKKAVVVKEYRNRKQYQNDANKMVADGYVIQGSPSETQKGFDPITQYWSRKITVTYVLPQAAKA